MLYQKNITMSKAHVLKRYSFLIWILFFVLSTKAEQQDYYFRQISLEQGLSQSRVQCIYRDHQGVIWIGTKWGLNSYDQSELKSYFHDREQPQRLRIVRPGQVPRHLRCLDLRQIRMMPPIIFQNELFVQPLHVRIVEHRKFVRAVFRRLKHAVQHQLAQSHQQLIILIIAAILKPRPRNGRRLHDRHTVQKPQREESVVPVRLETPGIRLFLHCAPIQPNGIDEPLGGSFH